MARVGRLLTSKPEEFESQNEFQISPTYATDKYGRGLQSRLSEELRVDSQSVYLLFITQRPRAEFPESCALVQKLLFIVQLSESQVRSRPGNKEPNFPKSEVDQIQNRINEAKNDSILSDIL